MRGKHLKRLVSFGCVFAASCIAVAQAELYDLTEEYYKICVGMFAKSAIPGGVDPSITVKFEPIPTVDVAVVFFESKDESKLGHPEDENDKVLICNKEALEKKYCNDTQYGSFIVPDKDPGTLDTKAFKFSGTSGTSETKYTYNKVEKTGYYCVAATKVEEDGGGTFSAIIDWRNPYGELPGSDYPKLPFYGLLSLVYLGIGIVWMVLSIMHWREILPVQNYISGVILFLMIEMAFNWGYWENYNAYGSPSTVLLWVVAVLNAGRNSISFFMLLIVCMGYGVVKPTLGSTMTKCRFLAGAHFIFGVIYAAGTMMVDPETSGPLVLLIIFPLALTMTIFHMWTLQSLTQTIQTLEVRRQKVKALMYRRLFRLLLFSVCVLGVFFVINLMNYWTREDPDYQNTFAMSDELGQEDVEDLEINTLRAAENLGYDNVKYRDRPSSNGNNSTTIVDDEEDDRAIFDIGDDPDGEEYFDERHSADAENTQRNSGEDFPRVSEDEEGLHLQQEISKLN
ncbi:12494_t:CDS:10 [Ambispora gerdemannii]|uniref:12494_t:CDS:1 n=1 Tax=Ambispora gerdemannii TaxID=144530 RepID=A0A9N8UW48_9GLOM|nr:12494_t:CDS:10 [Ambispora gerdemannii]